ncbi:hypothetical protein MFLAVUS_001833 [Mucor flavus]|uniref:Uncharacterized protein n=1 Tax=Mucor flavus TaxID=439312 RepID=A0ABP9YNM4_9FUNG
MSKMNFSTDLIDAKSRFIYQNQENAPTHIYRHNLDQFELREIKQECTTVICELSVQDIKDKDSIKDVQFQYAHYLYDGAKLLFLIVTETADGLESFIYLFDPLHIKTTLKRFVLTKKLKGHVSNIFISKPLKNNDKDDYYILTIGTLDSAIYVIRFTFADILKEKEDNQALACALIRTDARNAITQEIVVLNQQSNSPANVLLLCGGSNGVIDFFLMKGDSNIEKEPVLEYQRHDLIKLPSKLPIVSLQWLTNLNDKQIVLGVGQELFKPMRISRLIEPSMTILKLNIKGLICKDSVTVKFPSGTHLNPLQVKPKYKLSTCYLGTIETRITTIELTTDKIGDKTNTFLTLADVKDLQQVYIPDQNNCWILDKNGYIKLTTIAHKSRKRRHHSP